MSFDKDSLLLYIVTDRTWLAGRTLASRVEAALQGGATCVQMREKELDAEAFLREARAMREVTARHGVPFIVNDDVEIALACGADGVHVGQSDLKACEARKRIGPGKILGVSVHTVEQAVQAAENGADYLGVGAVFSTSTKQDADRVSADMLQNICRAVSVPVVAIGGISAQNIAQLSGSGIAGVAVISAIFASPDAGEAARQMKALAQEAVRL